MSSRNMPPGSNPDCDSFMASQGGIGEKDLTVALEHAKAAGLVTDMIAGAHDRARRTMTEPLPEPAEHQRAASADCDQNDSEDVSAPQGGYWAWRFFPARIEWSVWADAGVPH